MSFSSGVAALKTCHFWIRFNLDAKVTLQYGYKGFHVFDLKRLFLMNYHIFNLPKLITCKISTNYMVPYILPIFLRISWRPRLQCSKSSRAGVKFEAEDKSCVEEENSQLHEDLADLFISLLNPLDTLDGSISNLHLKLVIECLKNARTPWRELTYGKIAQTFCQCDETLTTEERNEKLMQRWLLPKLTRSINLNVNHRGEREDLCMHVTDGDVEEPDAHNFRLAGEHKSTIDVLSRIWDFHFRLITKPTN